jgi:hypothetical protein
VAVLEIITYPGPILLREAQTVPRVTRRVRRLARDMLETMYAAMSESDGRRHASPRAIKGRMTKARTLMRRFTWLVKWR